MKNYYDLNSKERFYRTLWFLPVGLTVLAAVLWLLDDSSRLMRFLFGGTTIKLAILSIVSVVGMVQLMTNYKAWRREERNAARSRTIVESSQNKVEHSQNKVEHSPQHSTVKEEKAMAIIIPKCSISEEIEKMLTLLRKQKLVMSNRFTMPVSEQVIQEWEQTHMITLPEQYKEWLRFSNGSKIHGQLAVIFGLSEIGKKNPFVPDHLVYIGDLVGDFECLCFDRTTGQIVSFLDVYQVEHLTTYDNFKDFLNTRVIRTLKGDVEEDIETRLARLKQLDNVGIEAFIRTLKSGEGDPLTAIQMKIIVALEEELKTRENKTNELNGAIDEISLELQIKTMFSLKKEDREDYFRKMSKQEQTGFMKSLSLAEQREYFDTSTDRTTTLAFNSLDIEGRKAYMNTLDQVELKRFVETLRVKALELFWTRERELIKKGLGTRDWSAEEMESILNYGICV